MLFRSVGGTVYGAATANAARTACFCDYEFFAARCGTLPNGQPQRTERAGRMHNPPTKTVPEKSIYGFPVDFNRLGDVLNSKDTDLFT